MRAAGLAQYLSDHYGMYLNGLILVSGVLDFETINDRTGNDVPYPLYLPAYTAAAQAAAAHLVGLGYLLPGDEAAAVTSAVNQAKQSGLQ